MPSGRSSLRCFAGRFPEEAPPPPLAARLPWVRNDLVDADACDAAGEASRLFALPAMLPGSTTEQNVTLRG